MSELSRMTEKKAVLGVNPFAYPLDDFYAQAGRALPVIEVVPGPLVPEPQRRLLVHNNDMTPTLEGFFKQGLCLEVLSRELREDLYFREVLLRLERTGEAVEFGAIKIFLSLFPSPARRQILEEKVPLGQILHDHKISHSSRPKAFLRIRSDEFINGALGLKGPHWLYGRRNTLSDPSARPLAEIVEILPPLNFVSEQPMKP